MMMRSIVAGLAGLLLGLGTAVGAEAKLTLHVPFDGSVDAQVAAGESTGKFEGKKDQLQFAEGIHGKGLLTGRVGQAVTFAGKGNISPDQWTITFWVKGLAEANWHTPNIHENINQEFWQLFGSKGGSTRFYKYSDKPRPWLLNLPRKGEGKPRWIFAPQAPETAWHFWAVTWRKGAGANLYLDGHLVGQDATFDTVADVKSIVIGQQFGLDKQNKILDEFKIYDAAMDAGAVARQYWQEGQWALNPTITVGPARGTIEIDGKIDPAEWAGTGGFSGLVDSRRWSIEPPATWGQMSYDEKYLYVAMHSDMPEEIKNSPDTTVEHGFLKSDATQHDGLVSADDSFYLKVMPPAGGTYFFYVNGIGTIYDYSLPREGGVNLAWESRAKVKSIVDTQGWTLEAAIPLSAFGIEHIEPGTTWRMDLGRVWKMLRQRTDAWAAGQRGADGVMVKGPAMGTVQFVGKAAPVADLKMLAISPEGRVRATLESATSESAVGTLTATLSAGGKVIQEKKVQGNEVAFDAAADHAAGQMVEVTVKSGDQVLLRQAAPIIPQQVGQLAMWSYPSRGQLRVGWVIQSASAPSALALKGELKDAHGKVVARAAVEPLTAVRGSTLMDIRSIPEGSYTLEVAVNDKQGAVQQQTFPFEKKPLPQWVGNTLGISDTPPPPWTDLAVEKSGDAVSIWGRTYAYGGRLLPEQIVNQGKAMLAGPMRLVVRGADGKAHASSEGKAESVQWTEASAVRADSVRTQTVGPLTLRADSYVEFDGMTWMELTVSPAKAGQVVHPTGVTVEIPLQAAWAKLINPYDYSLRQTGALPQKGWSGSARPLWVGNGDGGIQFFQETTASWVGSRGMEVVPDGKGAVVLRVHLIDQPVALSKPLQFAFGWTVSPVKAAPKDHRDWRVMSGSSELKRGAGTRGGVYLKQAAAINPSLKPISMWWQGWWWAPGEYKGNWDKTGPVPVPSQSKQKNAVLQSDYGLTILGAPYGRLGQVGTANPWFAQFGDEWLADVNEIYRPDPSKQPAWQAATVSQSARSLRDFFAWGYDRLLNEGQVRALYFDVSRPVYDNNIYHGAGTPRPDGPPIAQYNILATRKTFQRIYTLLKAKHPEGRLFYHMSGQVLLPIDAFTDGLVDGENYTGMLNRKDNRGYEHVLRLDQFRAEYSAQNNFGPASVILPEFTRSGAIKPEEWKELGYGHAEYLLGLILVHDSSIWWSYFPVEVLSQAYAALDKTGLNSTWSFEPYWRQKVFDLPQGVVASLYVSPDKSRAVVVVMNVSGKDQALDLPVTGQVGSFTNAAAVYPEAPIRLEGGAVRGLEVKNNNFRAILFKP